MPNVAPAGTERAYSGGGRQPVPEHLPFRLVDAFAEQPYTGNPAGVVFGADALNDRQMQAIAREINASETAFISRTNDLHAPPRLRWFTPTAEVGFCGHATLAAAHVWAELLELRDQVARGEVNLEFATAAGTLTLRPERVPERDDGLLWWLAMPDPQLRAEKLNPVRVARPLGLRIDDLEPAAPLMRTRDGDLILLISSWQRLTELRPDFPALIRLSKRQRVRGFCVATRDTPSDFVQVVSRFFAPAVGVPEDPVTGSVHGPLAVLLTIHGLVPTVRGRAALNCLQGQPGGRTGLVRALVAATADGYHASVGGMCQTTACGELRIPPPTG